MVDRAICGLPCSFTGLLLNRLGNGWRLRIPGDLSVIGFDNQHSVADSLFPGLTTMALPHYEMGPGGCGILWTRSSSMGTGPPSMWLSPAR